MKILKKALFMVIFVPVHMFSTVVLLQRAYNYSPVVSSGLLSKLLNIITVAFLVPVILAMVWFDPDGERIPRSLQYLGLLLNSIIWAAMVLCVIIAVRRLRRRSAVRK